MYPKMTPRDIDILLLLYRCRYLTGSQICAYCFPSQHIMWRRMSLLLERDLVKSFTVLNINERIFHLDKKGAEAIAAHLEVEIDELNWRQNRQPKDYYFIKHFLAINDLQILITKACQKSPITLLRFIPEYIGTQTRDGHVKKLIRDRVVGLSHTPDAVFSLQKDGKPALFFGNRPGY